MTRSICPTYVTLARSLITINVTTPVTMRNQIVRVLQHFAHELFSLPLLRQGRTSLGYSYREYNPDSAGTRRDECLSGDSLRQVLGW